MTAWIRERKVKVTRRNPDGLSYQVLYRRGGRATPIKAAGTFKAVELAEIRREEISWLIAACLPIPGEWPDRAYIYYAEFATLIKIGWSENPLRRARDLQADLLAVEVGDKVKERELHERFAAHRARGEWFHDCPEIREHIASIATASRLHLRLFQAVSERQAA